MIYEYVEYDLKKYLEIKGKLNTFELKLIVRQILEAINFAHQHQVLHRDLKPQNILIKSNGTVKLLAEPTVTCMSGTSSSILAGGEFAVPTIIGLGGGQATSFRGFGTSLVVTPTVVDRDLIRLQVTVPARSR